MSLLQSFLQIKNLIIFIGSYSTFIIAFKDKNVVDAMKLSLNDEQYFDKIGQFLSRFKRYHISILLDNFDLELVHEPIPVLEAVMMTNPVQFFIDEHYTDEQLVSYITYDVISDRTGEVHNTIIASVNYQPPISIIIDNILTKSFKFEGVYFLNLEFQAIIDRILVNHAECTDKMQIFASIVDTAGIKIIAKHSKDIRMIRTIAYPSDKSDAYVQGIVEQEISDCLISLKTYISKLDSGEVYIVFLANNIMLNLFEQSNFENCKKIYFNHDQILTSPALEKFSDQALTQIFAESKSYSAFNNNIKSIKQLSSLSALIFQPFYVVIVIMVIIIASFKFEDMLTQHKIHAKNEQYYNLTSKYRNVIQNYTLTYYDLLSAVILYKFNNILKVPIPTPFDILDKTFTALPNNINIKQITWRLDDLVDKAEDISMQTNIKFNYLHKYDALNTALTDLNEYITKTNTLFNGYTVQYIKSHDDKIIQIRNQNVIIPVEYIINYNYKSNRLVDAY